MCFNHYLVYGIVHRSPILLEQAMGYLLASCTTAVMVSAKASLTCGTIPPQVSSSTLRIDHIIKTHCGN